MDREPGSMASRTSIRDQDILLIDEAARFTNGTCMGIEHCDGATIITTDSVRVATELLKTVAVGVIYDFRRDPGREETERLGSFLAEHYPHVRLISAWLLLAGQAGGMVSTVRPLEVHGAPDRRDLRRILNAARTLNRRPWVDDRPEGRP